NGRRRRLTCRQPASEFGWLPRLATGPGAGALTTDPRAPQKPEDGHALFGSLIERRWGPSVACALLCRRRMRLHDVAGFGFALVIGVVGCGGVTLSPDGGHGGTAGAGAGSAGAQGR